MHTKKRTRIGAVTLSLAMLVWAVVLVPEAAAQSRARSIRTPSRSGSGLRTPSLSGRSGRTGRIGNRGTPSVSPSRSGSSGLKDLGDLFDAARRKHQDGYYDRRDHHGYSDAEAYRDVGIANAVVDLIGILVSASSYQPYAPVATAPVEIVPAPVAVAPPPPVPVVPGPTVILQTPIYSAPPPYMHLTPPRPTPYPGVYPGYRSAYPSPRYSPGYRGGHRHYKAPTTLRSGQRTTPSRAPVVQSRPAPSRGRRTAVSSGVRRSAQRVQRAPMKTQGWSYRVR